MKTFKMTDKHIKLLRNANVRWEDIEYGAPAIDGKRPYGNSDVTSDIVKLLFGDVPEDAQEALSDYARQLHKETETALQIILSTGTFEPGNYVSDDYFSNWKLEGTQ